METMVSFHFTPSSAFKLRFSFFEVIFVAILLYAVPVNAHGTVVSISIGNLSNSVRCVDVTADGGLRFWIGNIELDVPYDKITARERKESSGESSTNCFMFSYSHRM